MAGKVSSPVSIASRLGVLPYVTLTNTFGNGLFLATQVLFFTRGVGLSVPQVGLGLAIAGACAIFAGLPFGRLADRFGPRRVLTALLVAEGVGVASYTMVQSFGMFLPLVVAVSFADQGCNAVRATLIAAAVKTSERVEARAFLRSVANVGMGAGAAVASVALQFDTRQAYGIVTLGDSLTFLLAAALLSRVHVNRMPSPIREKGRHKSLRRTRWFAISNRRYLLITAINGIMVTHVGILSVGVPLWIAGSTDAPRWVVSVVMVLNMAMVVLFQVRTSRGIDCPQRAGTALLRAGGLLAIACAIYAAAHETSGALTILTLLVGGIAHTLGEMLSVAAGWTLSYDLADPAAQGEYQGVFNIGNAAGSLLSPLLVTATAIRSGVTGWLILGGAFLVAGAVSIPTVRRAVGLTTSASRSTSTGANHTGSS
jgi:MFS family permease